MSDLPSPNDVCGCAQGYKRGECPVCTNDGTGRTYTTIRWFGESWSAPVCRDAPSVPTPIGELCVYCHGPIARDDQGLVLPLITAQGQGTAAYHRHCYISSIMPCPGCDICKSKKP